MSDEQSVFEKSFMILICQDDKIFLDAINRGVSTKVLIEERNKSLYLLLRKYFKHYKKLPTPEELVIFSNTADGVTKEQKERDVLLYQELLVATRPDISGTVCIDSLFQIYKRNAAKDVALRLADEKNQQFIDSTLDKMVTDLTKIKNAGNKEEDIVDYKVTASERIQKYQQAKERKNSGGLLYCFPTLNKITGGQDRGTLWIIRGGPKAGKSTALINMANHVVKTGKNIVYFSAEVSRAVIERRLDALNCGIDMNELKRGTLAPEQEERYIDWLSNPDPRRGSFIIVDAGAMTTEYIRARMLDFMSKMPIDLVVVDYLSLLHMPFKMEAKWLEVGEIAKALRAIAKEFNVPVLTAVQTNVRSGMTALSQEIENTTDLLLDISRENPDEDVISGAAVQINAKLVLSRDSGLGEFALDAQFVYSEMREVELIY
jgi:archaellum biogenesis ATPase FlaH